MLVVACNIRANIIRIPSKSQNACDCPFNDMSLGEHYTDAGGGLQHEGEHHQDPQQGGRNEVRCQFALASTFFLGLMLIIHDFNISNLNIMLKIHRPISTLQ
jgi:hypothetical protein